MELLKLNNQNSSSTKKFHFEPKNSLFNCKKDYFLLKLIIYFDK